MFPGVAFLVLSAFCTGILNSHRHFFLSYVSPVMWNAAQIAFVVAAGLAGATKVGIAHALAWGVVVGAVLEVADPGADRPTADQGRDPVVRPAAPPRSATCSSASARSWWAAGVVQLITYVDLVLASFLAVGAVSALSYSQVLYLLPISLFGISVAAAELPELSRLGPSGRPAIAERLFTGMERVTFYVAFTMSMYIFAGDVIVGALLQRGEFDAADTQVVWYTLAAFSLGLLGTTRSRVLQNGLFALDRSRLVARIAVVRVAIAAIIGALLMFPFDRLAIVGGSVERVGDLALRPLPDTVRLVVESEPRLGVVGLALGAAASSWIEYRLLRGALEWRIGALPGLGHDSRWSLIAAAGVGVLAAGVRAVTDDLAQPLALLIVVGAAGAVYLGITTTMGVGEAPALVGRARRLLPGLTGAPG